jgi:hypothetical protein
LFNKLNFSSITACGYNGTPGSTAITPYQIVCFIVFAIKKGSTNTKNKKIFDLEFPLKLKNRFMKIINS